MAHADYDCCAVCDSKMDYADDGNARTKEDMCPDCIKSVFATTKALITTGEELVTWIEGAAGEDVAALHIVPCYYPNDVDAVVKAKLPGGAPEKSKLTHDPCCSSHGVPMDCATYRRTHFVEVRPCCDAWANEHGNGSGSVAASPVEP